MADKIEIRRFYDDHDPVYLGCVEIPEDMVYEEAREKLDEMWGQWQEEVELPDADSEFIEWLGEHGRTIAEGNYEHMVGK